MNKRRTVLIPDGYNGHKIRMYADPIEEWPDGTVKLQCAEPGKEYMIAWRRKSEVTTWLNEQLGEI